MSSFLNRFKNLKTGSNHSHNNESDTGSICSFDEEGFLCPICHRKFADTNGLEHHYIKTHSQEQSPTIYEDTNGIKNSSKHAQIDDSLQEAAIWKQQFFVSEENRMKLSSDLMQQRQRVSDLDEELDLLHKQLRSTQLKVIEQSQEIGNLKATKDVSDAQLAMFTDELIQTQGELKEKQNQVDTLCNDLIPRPTNDDVDVLKRELISVQQNMNEISLEKEQHIEQLRSILLEIYEYMKRFNQLENIFDQWTPMKLFESVHYRENIVNYDDMINNHTSQIQTDITQLKQVIHMTRERKEKMVTTLKYMRNCLNETQSNEQLINDLQSEQKQTNSSRIQIETLINENHTLEKTLDELQQEKNQLLLTKMDADQDEERRNLVQQLMQEKDEYQQQIKDLRKQIKQINEEKENIQEEFDNISKQLTQTNHDKNQLQVEQIQFNNEINSLKQQLDDLNKDKEQQINELNQELSSTREQYISINTKLENDLRETNDNQKQEIERLEKENTELKQTMNQQKELLNEVKLQLDNIQKEKYDQEKQLENNQQTIDELQLTISQLNTELDQKNESINRLTASIRRSIDHAHKTQEYIQKNIHTSQMNLLAIIEQAEQEFQTIRAQTLEEIRDEFTNYLTVIHTVIIDNKTKLEKQIEEQQHIEQQLNRIKNEHDQLIKEYDEQKQNFEIQLNKLNDNLLQTTESLTQANQTADLQRENFEKQIASLEHELTNTQSDLESRTKKYEMQFLALTENLATVRGELKIAHEKLVDFEQIKREKADLQGRLTTSQDENRMFLERSLTSESRNEKLLLENGQLAKKNSDLESALQELAGEYQNLQIHTNKLTQRRWLNDQDVHECMKCNQLFTLTQRKHHCRNCGNIFCDTCSSKTAIVAAASKKPQRVCDQCFKELTS
ncbi:unnamed protein product [Rotaria sp. Silwood1]|nr:unnamed protein product [Rotaria sp. Silwood1]CAF0840164.1 unnamed protein product [Rotaria sp. Silwood1]CAF4869489.1 unnamed protein product [Rotaria sp. Silwood1]